MRLPAGPDVAVRARIRRGNVARRSTRSDCEHGWRRFGHLLFRPELPELHGLPVAAGGRGQLSAQPLSAAKSHSSMTGSFSLRNRPAGRITAKARVVRPLPRLPGGRQGLAGPRPQGRRRLIDESLRPTRSRSRNGGTRSTAGWSASATWTGCRRVCRRFISFTTRPSGDRGLGTWNVLNVIERAAELGTATRLPGLLRRWVGVPRIQGEFRSRMKSLEIRTASGAPNAAADRDSARQNRPQDLLP